LGQITEVYASSPSRQRRTSGSRLRRTNMQSTDSSTIQTIRDTYETIERVEELESRVQLVTSTIHTLQQGDPRPLVTAISDTYSPSSPLQVAVRGVLDGVEGKDSSVEVAGNQATSAAVVIGGAVLSASASGAGALAGYAGLASAVSTLGGGAATTALASAAGITAASGAPPVGAAATTALVSAVGGPVIAAGVVVASVGCVGFGLYSATRWLGKTLFG